MITRAALPTAILAGTALVIWLVLATLIGSYSAIRRYSFFDQASTVFCYVGYAMPTFWLGIMLIFLFSGPGLNILPGRRDDGDPRLAAVRHGGVLGLLRRATRSRRSWTSGGTCCSRWSRSSS